MDSSILPITVIFAIILFIVKETVEFYRRVMANKRKVTAVKKLLSNEVEKNYWVIKSLRMHLISIQNSWHESNYILVARYPKGYRLEEQRSDGGGGGAPVYEVSTMLFDKIVFELPVLDAKLFNLAEQAYEGTAEIKHLTDSLVENIKNKDEHISPDFMVSFCEYALEELECSLKKLCALYQECTDKELTTHKLRTYT